MPEARRGGSAVLHAYFLDFMRGGGARLLELGGFSTGRVDPAERILYVGPETMRNAKVVLVPEKVRGQVTAIIVFLLRGDAGTAPSERVGFQMGDRIEAVDGIPPSATNDTFGEAFRRIGKASETRVRVRRHGRSIVLIYRASAGAP